MKWSIKVEGLSDVHKKVMAALQREEAENGKKVPLTLGEELMGCAMGVLHKDDDTVAEAVALFLYFHSTRKAARTDTSTPVD